MKRENCRLPLPAGQLMHVVWLLAKVPGEHSIGFVVVKFGQTNPSGQTVQWEDLASEKDPG